MSPLDQLCLFLLCLVLVARAFCEQLPPRSPALLRAPEEPPPASEQRAEGSRGGARGAAALIGQHLLSPPRGGSWEESSKVFFFSFFFPCEAPSSLLLGAWLPPPSATFVCGRLGSGSLCALPKGDTLKTILVWPPLASGGPPPLGPSASVIHRSSCVSPHFWR